MSILSVDNIQPIGSGTSVTVNSAATLVLNNVDSVGVATASNFKTGSSNLHSTGLTVGNNFLHSTGINVGTGATIHVPATNVLTFGTNSNERLRITSGGDVAINGTATTDAKLDVRTDSDPTTGVVVLAKNNTANGNGTFYMCDLNSVGNWSFGMPDNTNAFAIAKGIGNSGTEYLRIDSTGSVFAGGTVITESDMNWTHDTYQRPHIFSGITGGNPSDGAIVVASPETNPSNTRIGALVFGCKTSSTTGVSNSGLKAVIEGYANTNVSDAWKTGGYLKFITRENNGELSERLRINSDGDLQIGTSANPGNALRYVDIGNYNTGGSAGSILRLLTVKSDGSSSTSADIVKYKAGGLVINNNEAIGTSGYISFGTATGGGSTTERLRISSGGHISQGGGAEPSSSNGSIGLKFGIKSTANNVIIGETTQSGNGYGLHIESRQTGRSGNARIAQIGLKNDANGNGQISFFTSASGADVTERLRISSQGYVTKPAHPSFYVRRSIAGDGRSAATPITEWSSTYANGAHNQGSHFNTSTGLFTAPVSGIYHFSAAGGYKQASNNFNQKLRLNSTLIAEGVRMINYPDAHSTATISATVYMAAGNTMSLAIETTHHVNTSLNFFSGHLVG